MSSRSSSREFEHIVTSRHGKRILIRQVQPEDKPLFVEGLSALSNQDRYQRFFQHVPTLDEKLLKQLTEVDHVKTEAIGAIDITDAVASPVGVARYVATKDDPGTAEFALTVASNRQGEGFGRLLLEEIGARAVTNGFLHLCGFVLVENIRMINLLNGYAGVKKRLVDNMLEIVLPLPLREREKVCPVPAQQAGCQFRAEHLQQQ